jgi:hypothetical protein
MLTEEQRDMSTAALCVAVLVAVAFFSSYAGTHLSKEPSPSSWKGIRDNQTEAQHRQEPAEAYPSSPPKEALPVEVFPTPKSAIESAREQQEKNEKTANDRALTTATEVIACFTIVLALIAIVQAGLFVWQLMLFVSQLGLVREGLTDAKETADATKDTAKATGDAVSQAKNTSIQELRAYVLIDKAEFTIPDASSSRYYTHLHVKNFGATPARVKIRMGSEICQTKREDFVIPLASGAKVSSTIIAPNHKFIMHVDHTEDIIDSVGWNSMPRRGRTAYTWGRIDYLDVFDEPRWTTFQLFCPFGDIVTFAICQVGNDYA